MRKSRFEGDLEEFAPDEIVNWSSDLPGLLMTEIEGHIGIYCVEDDTFWPLDTLPGVSTSDWWWVFDWWDYAPSVVVAGDVLVRIDLGKIGIE